MGTLLALLLLQDPVDAAVRKGLEFVKTSGTGELALWTLVACDVPDNDPGLRGLFGGLGTPESTTSAALQAMILEDLDRLKYRDRIAHCAQLLIDAQCRDGRWDVGRPVKPPDLPAAPLPLPRNKGEKPLVRQKIKLTSREAGGEKGDAEPTRWALWGLLAGYHAGLVPPAEVVEKAAAAWRQGVHDPADLITGLSICLYLSNRDWKKDPDVLKSLERLAAEKRTAPGELYVLERAMMHFNSETLGGGPWYPRVTKTLLDAQKPDGSWGGLEETCYATLTLYKRRRVFQEPLRK
ncbi:MAG TPA: hypothetical protein VF950_14920 [Planctomycetota bacterium]